MIDLTGKTALITGAASGIGYGMAKRLAECGANVALCDIQTDIHDIANEIASATNSCLLYTSPSPRDGLLSRMPSSA